MVFGVLTRVWQALAGLVTLYFIARFFTPEVQGFYYTFASLIAMQVFVELGLFGIIVVRASHEWSKLALSPSGEIVGDPVALSRLASLASFVAKWYAGAALIFVAVVGLGGYAFLSRSAHAGVAWEAPWCATVILAGFQLWLMPFISLLEGSNQVVTVNRFRLAQTVADALAMWALFGAGAGLWVAAGSVAVKATATALFLAFCYRQFFSSLWRGIDSHRMSWRGEILPMQWRLAAQGAVHYLAFSLFTPVMFHFHGPAVAGRMGMTLQIVSFVQLIAATWVQTKVPLFGILAAQRSYEELDRLWKRLAGIAMVLTTAGSLVIWLGVAALGHSAPALGDRLVAPGTFALFLLAFAALQLSACQAAYLRAYGREPFLLVGVASSILVGATVLLGGMHYGPLGAGAGLLLVTCTFTVPATSYVWWRRRAEWQAASPPPT